MPWFHSLRESLGAALLLNEHLREAEQTFRDDLRLNPNSGRSLFGLWKALAAEGRSFEAHVAQRKFAEAWKNADTMPSVVDLDNLYRLAVQV